MGLPRLKSSLPSRLRFALILSVMGALGLMRVFGGVRRNRRPRVSTFAPRSPARVVHVVDGDTAYFALTSDGAWVKGRLAGINTPECNKIEIRRAGGLHSARCRADDEYFGLKAYQLLRRLLEQKPLTLDCERRRDGECRTGSYGRVLVKPTVGKRDVAERLVRAGVAWTYTRYPSHDRARLCRAEFAARRSKRGMWTAGSVSQVLARMHPRTRRWYAQHDARCREAIAARTRDPYPLRASGLRGLQD